ncbi:MAG: Rho GTPase-activating protein [Vibrionaceae bacterium]
MTTTPPGGGGNNKPPVPPRRASLENLVDTDAAANADAPAPASPTTPTTPAMPIAGASNSDESPQTGAAGAASASNSDGEDYGNGQGTVSRRLQRRAAIKKSPHVPLRTQGVNELADGANTTATAGQAATPGSRSPSPEKPPISPKPKQEGTTDNQAGRSRSPSPPPRPPKPQDVRAAAGGARTPSPKPPQDQATDQPPPVDRSTMPRNMAANQQQVATGGSRAPTPPPVSTIPRRPPSSPAAQGNKLVFSQVDEAGVPVSSPYPKAERGPENLAAINGLKMLLAMVQSDGAGAGAGAGAGREDFLSLCLKQDGIFRLSPDKKDCDAFVNKILGKEAPSSPKTTSKFKGLFGKTKKADAAEAAGLPDVTPLANNPILWAGVVKQLTKAALTESEKTWLLEHAQTCQKAEGTPLGPNFPTPLDLLPLFLRELFGFCSKVAEKSAVNKMTPSNLAVCIAPNMSPDLLNPADFIAANKDMMHLVMLYIENKTCSLGNKEFPS